MFHSEKGTFNRALQAEERGSAVLLDLAAAVRTTATDHVRLDGFTQRVPERDVGLLLTVDDPGLSIRHHRLDRHVQGERQRKGADQHPSHPSLRQQNLQFTSPPLGWTLAGIIDSRPPATWLSQSTVVQPTDSQSVP